MARKVDVSVTLEISLLLEDGTDADDLVRAWAEEATMEDLVDEGGNEGDVTNVVVKETTVLDSKSC